MERGVSKHVAQTGDLAPTPDRSALLLITSSPLTEPVYTLTSCSLGIGCIHTTGLLRLDHFLGLLFYKCNRHHQSLFKCVHKGAIWHSFHQYIYMFIVLHNNGSDPSAHIWLSSQQISSSLAWTTMGKQQMTFLRCGRPLHEQTTLSDLCECWNSHKGLGVLDSLLLPPTLSKTTGSTTIFIPLSKQFIEVGRIARLPP